MNWAVTPSKLPGAAVPFGAMTVDLEAPITRVTVYVDSARVVRRGRVALPVGPSTVVVHDLPASVRDESVRCAVRGTEAVRLGGIDVTTSYASMSSERALTEAVAQLDRLRDEDAGVRDEV